MNKFKVRFNCDADDGYDTSTASLIGFLKTKLSCDVSYVNAYSEFATFDEVTLCGKGFFEKNLQIQGLIPDEKLRQYLDEWSNLQTGIKVALLD